MAVDVSRARKIEPRRFQNRAQSIPERKKSDQKRQQAQQDAKNAPKTRPRATKAPTWPQHEKIWTCMVGYFWPPLVRKSSMLIRNKCLWGLTRLALPAARRIFSSILAPKLSSKKIIFLDLNLGAKMEPKIRRAACSARRVRPYRHFLLH